MKKNLFLITSLICLLFSFEKAYCQGFDAGSDYYFLIDADTKEVLLSKNADLPIPPSSMTKVMTAYVVFDLVKQGKVELDNQCLVGKDAWRKSGSSMFLNYGDVVTIKDLLRGLLAVSGNDAAIALAESTAGGIDKFIRLMNLKAKEIGLKDSHFMNPHGLYQPEHYMSLRDLAKLTIRFLNDFPEYKEYLGIEEFTYGKITQKNRNPLIKQHYDGVIGGKTGHTNQGGYGVVGVVKRDHRTLVAIVNKAKTPSQRSESIVKIFDYGFKQYKKLVIFEKGQKVASLKTWLGDQSEIDVHTNQQIAFNIPRNDSKDAIKVKVEYLGPLYAPIAKNSKVANLVIEIKGYKNFSYPLFTSKTVEKASYFQRITQVLQYKLENFFN